MFAGGNRDHGASNNRKGRPIHNLRTGRRELEVNPSHRRRPGYLTNSGQQFTPKGRKTLGGPKPWGFSSEWLTAATWSPPTDQAAGGGSGLLSRRDWCRKSLADELHFGLDGGGVGLDPSVERPQLGQ
jgi:hypothetical protein